MNRFSMFAVVLLVGIVSTLDALGQPSFQPPPGPLAENKHRREFAETAQLKGEVSFSMLDKTLSLDWTYVNLSQVLAEHSEDVSLTFWPTAIARMPNSPSRFVVAGRTTTGNTIIQAMNYEKPITYDTNGNPVLHPVVIQSVSTLYNQSVTGRQYVYHMAPDLLDADKLIIQFYDSGDLYRFTPGIITPWMLLASASSSGGSVLQVPEFDYENGALDGLNYNAMWLGDHNTVGHVYVFRINYSEEETLILKDTNRNGTLDSIERVGPFTWASSAYPDLAAYSLIRY